MLCSWNYTFTIVSSYVAHKSFFSCLQSTIEMSCETYKIKINENMQKSWWYIVLNQWKKSALSHRNRKRKKLFLRSAWPLSCIQQYITKILAFMTQYEAYPYFFLSSKHFLKKGYISLTSFVLRSCIYAL